VTGVGTTVTLQAGLDGYSDTEDTYIYVNSRYQNYGASSVMFIREANSESALVRFGLPATIPAGARIVEARLELYAFGQSRSGAMDARLFALRRPWQGDAATWLLATSSQRWGSAGANDARTDRAAEPAAQQTIRYGSQWVSFDITALAQAWLDVTEPNYGVLLTGVSYTGIEYRFYSSEYNLDSTLRPRLIITYIGEGAAGALQPAPTPTATATPTPVTSPWESPWCIPAVLGPLLLLASAFFLLLREPTKRRRRQPSSRSKEKP